MVQGLRRWAGLVGGPCAAVVLGTLVTHPVPPAAPPSSAAEAAAAEANAADTTTWVGTAPTLPFRVHTEQVLGVSYPGTAPAGSAVPRVAAHPAGITPLVLTLPGTVGTLGAPGAVGALGVPVVALKAYHAASDRLAAEDAACHLPWNLLAGIGRIESGHARGGRVDATGRTGSPILGPVLDGTAGNGAIGDTDGGRFDGDTVWDRAVGPMQFIPTTWARWGADGNGDGVADPSNIFDATLAAGEYLCSYGKDLSTDAEAAVAVLGYNHSDAYVTEVLAWSHAYQSGVQPEAVPPVAPQVTTPPPTTPAAPTTASAPPAPPAAPTPPAPPTSPAPTSTVTSATPPPSSTPSPTPPPSTATPTTSPAPTGAPTSQASPAAPTSKASPAPSIRVSSTPAPAPAG